jgi:hypothetical protein
MSLVQFLCTRLSFYKDHLQQYGNQKTHTRPYDPYLSHMILLTRVKLL